MESFRVRHSSPDYQRKLLLPMSLGVSSVALLHVVDHHLKNQRLKTSRTGFALIVAFVDISTVDHLSQGLDPLFQAKDRYPDHTYESLSLHEVFGCEGPQNGQPDV